MFSRHVDNRQRAAAERFDFGEIPVLRRVAALAAGANLDRA